MSWEAVVEAVASGTGTSIGVAALARRWFRGAVRDVVRDEMTSVVERQRQVMAHLDKQDQQLREIKRELGRR